MFQIVKEVLIFQKRCFSNRNIAPVDYWKQWEEDNFSILQSVHRKELTKNNDYVKHIKTKTQKALFDNE